MELLFEIRISYSKILYQMKFIKMLIVTWNSSLCYHFESFFFIFSLSNLIDIPRFAETKDT